MKISDILGITDNRAAAPEIHVTVTKTPTAEPTFQDTGAIERMKQIAGLLGNKDGEYSNSPEEKYATIDDVMSHGEDPNRPKHPSDIRTNAPSMYPGLGL